MPATSTHSVASTAFAVAIAGVGYQLLVVDGTAHGNRVTAGIAQPVACEAIYGSTGTLPDEFGGLLLWDTGACTPVNSPRRAAAWPRP